MGDAFLISDLYSLAWVAWILAFFAIELPAIFNDKKDDTLSEHVWNWFAIRRKGRAWRMRRVLLGGFMFWLSVHFLTGGWM